jgi:hypothetical protein
MGKSMIRTIIGLIRIKENYDVPTCKSSKKWGQIKSQRDSNGHIV